VKNSFASVVGVLELNESKSSRIVGVRICDQFAGGELSVLGEASVQLLFGSFGMQTRDVTGISREVQILFAVSSLSIPFSVTSCVTFRGMWGRATILD